ncbi:hypothetical protein M422DRAFT_239613 [Sphaerobolus stellatus SS14]|nr:hypothetical protein M422DRAFT_239613 [Sphaerobolus stellatus SS14]
MFHHHKNTRPKCQFGFHRRRNIDIPPTSVPSLLYSFSALLMIQTYNFLLYDQLAFQFLIGGLLSNNSIVALHTLNTFLSRFGQQSPLQNLGESWTVAFCAIMAGRMVLNLRRFGDQIQHGPEGLSEGIEMTTSRASSGDLGGYFTTVPDPETQLSHCS